MQTTILAIGISILALLIVGVIRECVRQIDEENDWIDNE